MVNEYKLKEIIKKQQDHIEMLERQFTCDRCNLKRECKVAWDAYNVDGCCLNK